MQVVFYHMLCLSEISFSGSADTNSSSLLYGRTLPTLDPHVSDMSNDK